MTDRPPTTSNNAIDPELLEILRCPLTKSRLRPEGDFLVAETGGLSYPVRDGIPVMLIEEAKLPAGVASLDELKARLRENR
ncbi:MAG: Trm112 family protein [Tepidisphaeraceae bacterium]